MGLPAASLKEEKEPRSFVEEDMGFTPSGSDKPDSGAKGIAQLLQLPDGQAGCEALALKLDDLRQDAPEASWSESGSLRANSGIVGPDSASMCGNLLRKGLQLESLSNFSSCRANACCFSGKWMYECTLHTAGIQQIGWATLRTPFTNEEGVGDHRNSFAYDGKRVKKWNESDSTYGQPWAAGDVIGACIDLDDRTVSFSRNGESLGVAFSEVATWREDLAYYPAISLSQGERCELNFGATPFRYPVAGYLPLHSPPPPSQLAAASFLLSCLERTAAAAAAELPSGGGCAPSTSGLTIDDLTLTAATIAQPLAPLLESRFVVEACLIPQLLALATAQREQVARQCLSLLLGVLEPAEGEDLARCLLHALCGVVASSPLRPEEFPHSGGYAHLRLVVALMKLPELCALWTQQQDFFMQVERALTVKRPTRVDVKAMLPQVWWHNQKAGPGASASLPDIDEAAHGAQLQRLSEAVQALEACHRDVLVLLLGVAAPDRGGREPWDAERDAAGKRRRRQGSMFRAFLEHLLKKNTRASKSSVHAEGVSDNSVLCSAFFVLLRLLRSHLVGATDPASPLGTFPASDMFLKGAAQAAATPSQGSETDPYHRQQRLGGLLTSVAKDIKVPEEELGPVRVPGVPLGPSSTDEPVQLPVCEDAAALLDVCVRLYGLGVALCFKTASHYTQSMIHTVATLEESEARLRAAVAAGEGSEAELGHTVAMHRGDAQHSVRLFSFYSVSLLYGWKHDSLLALCVYLARCVQSISARQHLFSYVPEFYVECVVETFHALRRGHADACSPPSMMARGLSSVLGLVVTHFADPRIISPDMRDFLLQTISVLFNIGDYLTEFEKDAVTREQLIPQLMGSFESSWIQVTNILLRIVRGSGFGFNPADVPHAGSAVFAGLLHDAAQADAPRAAGFINHLFSTLAWTITEFTMALAELPASATAPARIYLQDNLHRKCSIMFELSVNLTRLLEFLCGSLPGLLLCGSRLNVGRVIEIVGFVLSHFVSGPNAAVLEEVLAQNGPGMEKVSAPKILAPVVGALINLRAAADKLAAREALMAPMRAAAAAAAAGDEAEPGPSQIGAGCAQPGDPATVHSIVEAMAEHPTTLPLSAFEAVAEVRWRDEFGEGAALGRAPEFDDLLVELRAARAAHEAAQVDAAAEGDVPDEFLDPIMAVTMSDPVLLPDSRVIVDRDTIERHLLSSKTDPFSRAELTLEQVLPAVELKQQIVAWRASRPAASNAAVEGAERPPEPAT